MEKLETEIQLPIMSSTIPNNTQAQMKNSQLPSIPSNTQSQINNNDRSKYNITSPNKSCRNIKPTKYYQTHQVSKSEVEEKKELNMDEVMNNKYNIPNPNSIIDELDQILMNKLQIEFNILKKQYAKSLSYLYEKENKALNAEMAKQEAEEKAREVLQEKKALMQKNYKLRETLGNLSLALSNAQAEVARLNVVIEQDKAYPKELYASFDIKVSEQQKKYKAIIKELRYFELEKEILSSRLDKSKEADLIKANKYRELMMTQKIKKPRHLCVQMTAEELSAMTSKLTLELEELKQRVHECTIEKHSMNKILKVQEKNISKQKENIGSLNLILEEKDKNAERNNFKLKEKKCYLNTLKNQTIKTTSQSLNVLNTDTDVNIASQTPLIRKRVTFEV